MAPSVAAADAAPPVTVRSCIEASENGQVQRRAGRLLQAKAEFLKCAVPTCPRVLISDCLGFLAEVAEQTPSVTVRVIEASGRDIPKPYEVGIDGQVTEVEEGRAFDIDPGRHSLTVRVPGRAAHEQPFVALERAKAAVVTVLLPPLTGPPPHEARQLLPNEGHRQRTTTLPGWIAFGVAGIGLGVAGAFYASGFAGRADLNGSCRSDRSCDASAVSDVRQRFVVADVALLATLLAAATGAVLMVRATGGR